MQGFEVKDLMVTVYPEGTTAEGDCNNGGRTACDEASAPPCDDRTACGETSAPPCDDRTACGETSAPPCADDRTACTEGSAEYRSGDADFRALSEDLERLLKV